MRLCTTGACLAFAFGLAGLAGPAAAERSSGVFVIAKYPVDATADDAVAAKTRAIAEGQKAALRSLLRRLVPVTSLDRVRKMHIGKVDQLVESYSVRSERNSSTQYIANLDFSFQPDGVRKLLTDEGIPFVDEQAPTTVLVLAYRAPAGTAEAPAGLAVAAGTTTWLEAWKGLDLDHSLAPMSLQPLKDKLQGDTVAAILKGDPGALRSLASEYQSERVVLAVAEPDVAARKLHVTLAGRDAVGPLHLRRSYRMDDSDLAYTSELAGIVSLSILDGRWKVIRAPASVAAAPPMGRESPWREPAGRDPYGGRAADDPFPPRGPPGGGPFPGAASGRPMQLAIEFSGMGEWQQISRQLASTPGVDNLEVEGLSARSARVSLVYPGPIEQLAQELAASGLMLTHAGSGWVLRGR
jgi:hypothetical protein